MSKRKKGNFIYRWRDLIESSMSAVAFAEANAPEIAEEILDAARAQTESVLFVVNGGLIQDRALQYVTELCHRMDCGLEVLNVLSDENERFQEELKSRLDSIKVVPTNLHTVQGALPAAVKQFMREHRRIISVVMNDHFQGLSEPPYRKNQKQRPWWQNLSCPVVFIPGKL